LKKIGNAKMHTALNGDLGSMQANAQIVGANGCVFARTESTDAKSATGAQRMEFTLMSNPRKAERGSGSAE
jgi:hypothetical protein